MLNRISRNSIIKWYRLSVGSKNWFMPIEILVNK